MWLWKCIVCEKDLTATADYEGDDGRACLPNLEGGTIDINFGFGSRFDFVDLNGLQQDKIQHQACICDDCYEKKMNLTRAVATTHTRRWNILDPNYRKQQDV